MWTHKNPTEFSVFSSQAFTGHTVKVGRREPLFYLLAMHSLLSFLDFQTIFPSQQFGFLPAGLGSLGLGEGRPQYLVHCGRTRQGLLQLLNDILFLLFSSAPADVRASLSCLTLQPRAYRSSWRHFWPSCISHCAWVSMPICTSVFLNVNSVSVSLHIFCHVEASVGFDTPASVGPQLQLRNKHVVQAAIPPRVARVLLSWGWGDREGDFSPYHRFPVNDLWAARPSKAICRSPGVISYLLCLQPRIQ